MQVNLISPENISADIDKLPVFEGNDYQLTPFDERTLLFFDALSKKILSNNNIKRLPEMAALGFWIRKSNLNSIKNENKHLFESNIYKVSPLGKIFHVCPANVDTMFIYSLTVSVLMGNKNVLKISERMNSPQIQILFDILNALIQSAEFSMFKNYINIISYGHVNEINEYISLNCNGRIIWGGDSTVKLFKSVPAAPRIKDIVFADRISVLFIDCNAYLSLKENEISEFAKKFFNDAYTFDQMGCSSPQTIYFIGDENTYKTVLSKLNNDLSKFISTKYDTDISSLASLKINRLTDDSIDGVISNRIGNNYLTFVELMETSSQKLLHSCGGGYFYVKRIDEMKDALFLSNSKFQTISYYKLTESDLDTLETIANGEGIDRIVPLGIALNFNYIWDGYNLLDELSKKIFIVR